MKDHSQYIHGTTRQEQSRLSLLNDLLNSRSIEAIGLTGGERILDVGSGLGQLTRAMARAAGHTVIGIERSVQQIAEARRQAALEGEESLAEFRQGDALHFPLKDVEWGTFDIAHTRFLLEHVPEPLEIVRTMVRAVRHGGRIILEDDDHDLLRLWPEPPRFAALWQSYMRKNRGVREHVRNASIEKGLCGGALHAVILGEHPGQHQLHKKPRVSTGKPIAVDTSLFGKYLTRRFCDALEASTLQESE